ncbi:hypothetical protein B0O80DRAFT_527913 [Mortierella sp. GBAus27b]|nr:hypothetical protein B0O80DRAFT_527913 [Mortierella sp. GBAus27b]
MFRAALKLLQSPDDDINKRKPVLALVSGIVNTLSPIGQQFTFSPLVEEQSRLTCLAYESKTVDELRADLQTALYPDPEDPAAMSVESLQKFVYESLSKCVGPRSTRAAREKYLVLQIVSQVLHWLENDVFAAPSSEHVFVSTWSDVFNTVLGLAQVRSHFSHHNTYRTRRAALRGYSAIAQTPVTVFTLYRYDDTRKYSIDWPWDTGTRRARSFFYEAT